jgi:hypothetical protein
VPTGDSDHCLNLPAPVVSQVQKRLPVAGVIPDPVAPVNPNQRRIWQKPKFAGVVYASGRSFSDPSRFDCIL